MCICTLCAPLQSPENELVVGSDDYMVRIFEGEDVVVESMETDKIIDFCHIHDTCFGFVATLPPARWTAEPGCSGNHSLHNPFTPHTNPVLPLDFRWRMGRSGCTVTGREGGG